MNNKTVTPRNLDLKMPCSICGSETRVWNQFNGIPILQCSAGDCGFRFFDLAKWTSPYQDSDYYAAWKPGEILSTAPWIRARVGLVRRVKQQGRIAELGCGFGETAIALHDAGYNVVGVEESKAAIDFLRSHYPSNTWSQDNIVAFLEKNLQPFDAITMFHVLEHIPEPKRVVQLVQSALRPDGAIVIEVPDVGGGQARLRGINWDYYLDHHVNYFDVNSLKKLLGSFGYRLRVLSKIYHFSHPQGHVFKDVVKGMLARCGYNSIIRTAWTR